MGIAAAIEAIIAEVTEVPAEMPAAETRTKAAKMAAGEMGSAKSTEVAAAHSTAEAATMTAAATTTRESARCRRYTGECDGGRKSD
jgi:hypothetical protein